MTINLNSFGNATKKEEESAKKMTVAEIEKELGYKVEIVSND